MSALNVITGRATNPAALTALTLNTGDSATVKSFPFGSKAEIIAAWAQAATPGIIRIRSPRLHDVNQGIRLRTTLAGARNLMGQGLSQDLVPQDSLTFEGQGGAAETDVFSFLVYYHDLPGINAHLISPQEVDARVVNVAGMEIAVTSSATVGQYGTAAALNATFDNWKRNVDYAIIGVLSDAAGATVGLTGPDTGQTRIGLPMTTEPLVGYNWFRQLSEENALPLVPVVNAANIAATFIDTATATASVAANVTLVVAELSGQGQASLV